MLKYVGLNRVAVVGGGASGMMAAFRALKRGMNVTVYDPNRFLGRKVRITGKGRCNVTNNCSVTEIMRNIPGDGRFLYSALNRFKPQDMIDLLEENGVPVKIERGNRVFPVSDNANDVADMFVRLISSAKIERKTIRSLDEIEADAIIIATGGCSYPLTGSNGNGYLLAKSVGHRIVKPKPSLIPLTSDDRIYIDLQDFAPKNIVLSAYENNRLIFREMGEMLFTHFGVSGPLVLSASAHMRSFDKCDYRLEIDFKPTLDDKKLDNRLLRYFEEFSNKEIKNVLPKLTGISMAPVVLSIANIPGDLVCNSVTKEQRGAIRKLLKAFPIHVNGTRPIDEAIVTSGGVDTSEVNPRTMQSKLDKRIFFAGEVLDLDAYTGGFNLQIAWSTGFVAGESVLL